MTSHASPKLAPSVLTTNTNTTKHSSSTSHKKEVNNNTTPRASNGNSSKPTLIHKKEPVPNLPIKRKTRVLASSDESDDDQSLVRKKSIFIPPIFFSFDLFIQLFIFLLTFPYILCSQWNMFLNIYFEL
jgi:hypothetical protein